ncbi:MAG: site-specific DNA-methyltransferase [Fibrobacteres bacterium]|nr:site-specific DNA-methyltransferase [Fibrobacterota bacterium]
MPIKSDRHQDLKQRIKTLPGLSTEDRQALLGLLAERKRYGLVWEDKPEAAHELLREKIPVFVEDTSRRIRASEDDAPHHVLIEGDNLHALAALQYTHAGMVDVIYIDPPYNTGNKDFRYEDDFVDKEDAYRHSKWLSFMRRRLALAKLLLADYGVIFVSLDDNELGQLRLLMHEIFGEGNGEGVITWRRRHNQPNDKTKLIAKVSESILVYSRSASALKLFGVGKIAITGSFSNPDSDPRGDWASKPWKTGSDQSGTRYNITAPDGRVFDEEWMGDEATYKSLLADGRIYFPKPSKKDGGHPRKKYYQWEREEEGQCATNWWHHDDCGHNQGANEELTGIFGEKNTFSNPKPTKLAKRIIQLGSIKKKALILDFFAGSGTTLHATMALNADDNGKRQCILVTNNENGICEEVCYERNKRVIQGYTTPKGEAVPGLVANHLHYLKTDFVNREPSLKNRRKLMNLAVDLLRLKEDAWERLDAACIRRDARSRVHQRSAGGLPGAGFHALRVARS